MECAAQSDLRLLADVAGVDFEGDMTQPDEINSIKSKIDRQDKKIEGVDEKLTGISERINGTENDLKWHRIVGWGIVGAFAVVLGWVITVHIPDKINDIVPANFKERFGAMEQGIKDIILVQISFRCADRLRKEEG